MRRLSTPGSGGAAAAAQLKAAPDAGRYQLSRAAMALLCELVLEARQPADGALVDGLVGAIHARGGRDRGWLDDKLEATLPPGRAVALVLSGAADLADGLVHTEGNLIECPKHNGCFDFKTGEPKRLPVRTRLATFPTKVEGDTVFVQVTDGKHVQIRYDAEDS